MKMLRYSGLAVLVVCIAAFASGCGGGGGTAADDEMDVVMCTAPQIEVNGQCEDPPQTDADRITEARRELSNILTNAQARAGAASSVAAAIQTNADATSEQITAAISHSNTAQSALALIVSANTAATLATTPAEANTALGNARAAQGTLNTSASAISSIQGAVQAAANRRMQREVDERALTNNSGLIKHLRDNKLLADAVRDSLEAGSLVVAGAGDHGDISSGDRPACTAPCAEYPANTRTSTTATTGQRTVRVGPTGSATTLVSDSTTPSLTGTGRLPHGFDLNNGATATTFVNAYTDISQERRARNDVEDDDGTTPYDERYDYNLDTDYLLAGIWLTVVPDNLSTSRITAFAYGGQPTASAASNFCGSNEGTASPGVSTTSGTTTTTRVCETTDGFESISDFVKDGQDFKATYNGNANGAYLAGSDTSYFTADVTLTAEFQNPTGGTTEGTGSIVGAVTNIVAGGQRMDGSIELQEQSLENDIGGNDKFNDGSTIGVVDGKSFGGAWKGQFFGMTRYTRSQTTVRTTDASDPPVTTSTITTTYSPQAPGSVAGTFYATQQSAPVRDAAFIGSFAAHR